MWVENTWRLKPHASCRTVGKPLRVQHFAYAGEPFHRKCFTAQRTRSATQTKPAQAGLINYQLPITHSQFPIPNPQSLSNCSKRTMR